MKPLLSILFLLAATQARSVAVDLPFKESHAISDSFEVMGKGVIELQEHKFGTDDASVQFIPEMSQTIVMVYRPPACEDQTPQKGGGDSVSVDFLIKGVGSMGLFLRGQDVEDPAYLVLINQNSGAKGSLRIFKTQVWPPSSQDESVLAQQDFYLLSQTFYRLKFRIRNRDKDSVEITALLSNVDSAEEIANVEVVDTLSTLREPGFVGLRFYAVGKSSSFVQVSNFQVEAEP